MVDKKIESKLNERIIRNIDFFYAYEMKDNFSIRNNINQIKSRFVPNSVEDLRDLSLEVTIVTRRPGLIIGKGGKDFKALKEYLSKELDFNVEIELIENKLDWYGGCEDDEYYQVRNYIV